MLKKQLDLSQTKDRILHRSYTLFLYTQDLVFWFQQHKKLEKFSLLIPWADRN